MPQRPKNFTIQIKAADGRDMRRRLSARPAPPAATCAHVVETARNLGLAYYSLGQVERAIEFHTQALAIAREIGGRRGEGIDCWNFGLLFEESGPFRAAALPFAVQTLTAPAGS